MTRLRDIIPLLSGTQYKKVQVLLRYDDEQYIDGYGTKEEQYISGYGTKTEQYIAGYEQKTITEVVGDDPYEYNAHINNKVGCITNKYATALSRRYQKATGTTCKLLNDKDVEVNTAYIDILNRCVESRSAASFHINSSLQYFGGDISQSIFYVLDNFGGSPEDRDEYKNPVRQAYKLGAYNPNSTNIAEVTRQVDDKTKPIYATREVTDYNSPIYSTRTVTDYNKPIYKTRKVPVYEEHWVEE